ncbi:hypothetical protein GCM10011344_42150 [Dokdonia pacifica]|uniref:Uncharacterized protein n=1 Tax=Dokdonia pacifica TaxID=1627892 RepID=A0A239DLD9_9FLAO|nr:hypothetical protein [Dokdonia pacifica]GGG36876.1 hypothetical protein GCM10011344_42150 [Dokdonia pacifica]SNS32871.1 hypothetical protein SAMN06265376_11164 [Dokdonia pacifica]
MLKNIKKVGEVLTASTQKSITGGNACIACYDHCVLVSRNRIELGDCFDNCQQTVC